MFTKWKNTFSLVVFIPLFLSGCSNQTAQSQYPQSTLVKESGGQPTFNKVEFLSTEMSCPSLPYDISVPDGINTNETDYLMVNYNDIQLILTETDGLTDALYDDIALKTYYSVDLPDITWEPFISDTGYINSYKAEYYTGRMKMSGKVKTQYCYVVSYNFLLSDSLGLFCYASCDDIDKLSEAKELLDAMAYTIYPRESFDTVSASNNTETVSNSETEQSSTANSLDGIDIMDNYIPEQSFERPSGSVTLDVTITEETEIYCVFMWFNDAYPSIIKLYDPNGREHDYLYNYSYNGMYAFHVENPVSGTYTFYVESMQPLENCQYYAMTKETFFSEIVKNPTDNEYHAAPSD